MHNPNASRTPDSAPNTTSAWDISIEGQSENPENILQSFDSEFFSPAKQREVMDSIVAPTDVPGGIEATMDNLRSKHELRILGHMSGAGFNNWEQTDARDLQHFVARFPSPAEFDAVSQNFLDMIGRANGSEKLSQYQTAMDDFKRKVYGQKQTYYEQMKVINALREENRDGQQHQIERTAEWVPGSFSITQVSRGQVRQGLDFDRLSSVEPDQSCQDAYLSRPEGGIFGVFDGAGGHDNGREASHAAAAAVDQACDRYHLKSGSDLAYVLNSANQSVRDATNNQGYTTATITKVIEQDDRKKLAYAQVGDSRLYIIHSDGSAELITRDEGEGNYITNALGIEGENRVKQYGEVAIESGDRVLICSDGITGDFGDDLMTEDEIGHLVAASATPEAASANLVAAARKTDDRTAIVFGI